MEHAHEVEIASLRRRDIFGHRLAALQDDRVAAAVEPGLAGVHLALVVARVVVVEPVRVEDLVAGALWAVTGIALCQRLRYLAAADEGECVVLLRGVLDDQLAARSNNRDGRRVVLAIL